MAEDVITIDRAGRLVIPIRLRRRLHLHPGSRLRVKDAGASLVLEPLPEDGGLEERDGLLVIRGAIGTVDADHRRDREARLDRLTPGL
jgi:AbrB family looped-hinge helix DNA binding protein